MLNPAGSQCDFFYGDYYRGRNREECRLLKESGNPYSWKPSLCFSCPVPEILRANACKEMILRGEIYRPFPYIHKQVKVTAYCTKSESSVSEPKIGCGLCHPLPSIFTTNPDGTDSSR
jgi:hypothetical protein